MTSIFTNNLYTLHEAGSLCKFSSRPRYLAEVLTNVPCWGSQAFGIKLAPYPAVVQIAKSAGFDALFIDLEHSTLSISDASQLCTTGLLAGVTPFVRVPYQCGNGFVQRVLDGGAMGVVFPHVSTREEATSAVSICKYPPAGTRSMTGQLPQFSYVARPHETVIAESNRRGSTVFVMIETAQAIRDLDAIASVEGVDVLLVGSNDLSIELGVPAQFESPVFKDALEKVSRACKENRKIMALAGIYDKPVIQRWAVQELGVGWILGGQDASFIAKGAAGCMEALRGLERE
ncbi:hypothetical protein A1O7_06672 [Cladophialophora yegresii CBS 114405]|uniref:HpcH/HpaI aldolase/citrate lyase domain-containing protein n=1 Tax=Cladophialophora yegresii CBS 114405 TaxID=1182544 RepID=W9W2K9_9EURO|nr:uncharacterized protein A1O7_06672 [Cladophialophora yegresii CBS 114405]EXJ59240.1 hypothetical protein A1O7_06672 [Cladophialophora yegresii CBS 114405]